MNEHIATLDIVSTAQLLTVSL